MKNRIRVLLGFVSLIGLVSCGSGDVPSSQRETSSSAIPESSASQSKATTVESSDSASSPSGSSETPSSDSIFSSSSPSISSSFSSHVHVLGKPVEENRIPATCTEPGSYEEVIYCQEDGEELSRVKHTLPALGHDYELTDAIAADYDHEGTEIYTCSRCGDSYSLKTGERWIHSFDDEWTIDARKGTHYHACLDEGFEQLRADEEKHQYGQGVVTAATSTEPGYTTFTCEVCGHQERNDATPPQDNPSFAFQEFVLEEDGLSYRLCGLADAYPEDIVVASTYLGLPVTRIASEALYECEGIKRLCVPTSVTNIGYGAFFGCASLEEITLPFVGESETGCSAFGYIFGCDSPNFQVNYVPESLRRVEILPGATTIGERAFLGCESIREFSFPETIKEIGEYAFVWDTMEEIVIPSSVESIGKGVFCQCMSLKKITVPFIGGSRTENRFFGYLYGSDSWNPGSWDDAVFACKTVVIGEGETEIPDHAFYGFNGLETVLLPNTIERIGCGAFFFTGLKSITLPSSVTEIAKEAFNACGLTEVNFGDGCKTIGASAFSNCPSLKQIVVPEGVVSIGENAFSVCSSLTSVTFPRSVKTIGKHAVSGCFALTDLTLPFIGGSESENKTLKYIVGGITDSIRNITLLEGATEVPEEGLLGWKSIVSVSLPSTIATIGKQAFNVCTGLTDITLPESLTSIGGAAFASCTSLKNLTIPSSVKELGYSAFSGCTELDSVVFGAGVEVFPDDVFCDCAKLRYLELPTTLKKITATAFQRCDGIDTVVYKGTPEDWLSLDDIPCVKNAQIHLYVHEDKTEETTDFYVPGNIDTIQECAFWNCVALQTLHIKEGVKKISAGINRGCASLTTVFLPASLTKVVGNAFGDPKDSNQELEVHYHGTVESWLGLGGKYWSHSVKTIRLFLGEDPEIETTEIVIPETVTTIPSRAFSGCHNLKSVTLSASVTSLGAQAFSYCRSLTGLSVVAENPKFDSRNDCNAIIRTMDSHLCAGCVTSVIPETVKSIGEYAFSECFGLTSVYIPAGVVSIDPSAFSYCQALSKIEVDENNPRYDSRNDCNAILWEDSDYVLVVGCASTVIPYGVKEIGSYAFAGNGSLSSIEIPSSVKTIGSHAFADCSQLSNLALPAGLKTIGEEAFLNCRSLSKLELPSGLTSIGYGAFEACSSVPSVIVPGSVATIGSRAFALDSSLAEVVLEEGIAAIGEAAFYECFSLKEIVVPGSVKSIGGLAFIRCRSLEKAIFQEGVRVIGDSPFSECESLVSLSLPSSLESTWNLLSGVSLQKLNPTKENGGYYLGNDSNPYVYLAGPYDLSLRTFAVMDGCSCLAEGIFAHTQFLTSVTLPESLRCIGYNAFANCPSLAEIILPQGLVQIQFKAFANCPSLATIYIPLSVVAMDREVFVGNPSLTIECQAESKPQGWDEQWAEATIEVNWGVSPKQS